MRRILIFLFLVTAALVGAFFWSRQEPKFVPAPAVQEVTITIPEGFTLKQIGQRVREALPHITADQWSAATGVDSPFEDDPFVKRAQKPDDVDLEGYLFPDTYRFFADASAADVVEKLLREMEAEFAWAAMTELRMTPHEALTLASIIEREVRSEADMRLVADLFLRRLDIGMPLQADSTVNYVTGNKTPAVSDEDRRVDSPWNTYLYPELPPGPIANPGRVALSAVFQPNPNDFWYFLTDKEGVVHYAKTNDEHNQNKALYLW